MIFDPKAVLVLPTGCQHASAGNISLLHPSGIPTGGTPVYLDSMRYLIVIKCCDDMRPTP